MATVSRSSRILAERLLVLAFFQMTHFASTLLDHKHLTRGLTTNEKANLLRVKTHLYEDAGTLRDIAIRIRSESQ